VFHLKISPEKIIKGKGIPTQVKFPNDEAFGTWAWTYNDLNRAIMRFLEIHKRDISKGKDALKHKLEHNI
jgi:hypothetical protein